MDLNELLESRRSIRFFDPAHRLEPETIHRIVERARLSPSGFNLQSWRFLAVTGAEGKRKLFECAWKQEKVRDASAVLVVCGDRDCYREAPRIIDDMVAKGYVPEEARVGYLNMVESYYRKPEQARDAVFRDAMLAAMTVLLSCRAEGVDSAPMSGFDAQALKKAFGLPDSVEPVLLVAMGKARKPNPPRGFRKPLEEVLAFEDWTL